MVNNGYAITLKERLIKANIIKRLASALIMLPLFIFVLYIGGPIYELFIILLGCIVIYEWCSIVIRFQGYGNNKQRKYKWYLLGLIYGLFAVASMLFIRSDFGIAMAFQHKLMLWMCIMVWTTDIAAYFCGIVFGGPKIMPKISPSKTWSGFLGALICCVIIHEIAKRTVVDALFNPRISVFIQWIAVILTSTVSQIGDFLESAFKRKFGVKDSGKIIPGHGGLMDRLDGLIMVCVVWFVILIMSIILGF